MPHDQPGSEHFDFNAYATKARWNSYWHQLDETFAAKPKRVLVVGGGDAVVPEVLRSAGIDVVVVDVVDDLEPDVVADVRDLPFETSEFDVAICCQVLEHIPFETVPTALGELRRVTSGRVVVSLPDRARKVGIELRVGLGRRFARRIEWPRRSEQWEFNGVHHWEVSTGNYPLTLVQETLAREFRIEREYVVDQNTYHRFFVLAPN